ncbi:MAG: adenosylmethionine--8-amino-7-oxononanoate transaminase [Verrucomicrobiota bacterium]
MNTDHLIALDKKHLWHPFTPNDIWLDDLFTPIVVESGSGSLLTDTNGKTYLDGNSSIWTNLHGHRHPRIHQAIRDQLDQIAHVSSLGLTNTQAPVLAEKLCHATGLDRCFLSDDGSTAMETALKMVIQYFQQNGEPDRTTIISLADGYHGDTVGAMSMGHSKVFHKAYGSLLFPAIEVSSPASYRSPYNRAKPRPADARSYAETQGECLRELEQAFQQAGSGKVAALVLEPRVQGAAGFLMHPHGYLKEAAAIAHQHGARLILDEVMTGFGRTGKDFAFQHENVQPDVIALAKGITSGTLPLAATLCREALFQGFSGDLSKTFYHGHSYSGNPLGCAAAIASWEELHTPECQSARREIENSLRAVGATFWQHPHVGDVRQEGCILAIELVAHTATRESFPYEQRIGAAICLEASRHGLLTRPVGDVLVLMPPYSTSGEQVLQMGEILLTATHTLLG